MMKLMLLLLLMVCVKLGYGYPGGAPHTVCDSMMPQHDVTPKPCQSNYRIQSDKSQYGANEVIRITVRGSTNADHFKGILLIAKSQNNQQIVGTWSITNPSLKTVSCNGAANTGITHSSADKKQQVEAVWQSPSILPAGNIIIKATIVKSYGEIYVDCSSTVLTPRRNMLPGIQAIVLNSKREMLTETNTNATWNDTDAATTAIMTTGQINSNETSVKSIKLE